VGIVLTVGDAVAAFPRWALGAYASAWRTLAGKPMGCGLDPAWAPGEAASGEAASGEAASGEEGGGGVGEGCEPRRTLVSSYWCC
jgi:hypothetical protein